MSRYRWKGRVVLALTSAVIGKLLGENAMRLCPRLRV